MSQIREDLLLPWRHDRIDGKTFHTIRTADNPSSRIVAAMMYPEVAAHIVALHNESLDTIDTSTPLIRIWQTAPHVDQWVASIAGVGEWSGRTPDEAYLAAEQATRDVGAEATQARTSGEMEARLRRIWLDAKAIARDEGRASPVYTRQVFARLVATDSKLADLMPWDSPAGTEAAETPRGAAEGTEVEREA